MKKLLMPLLLNLMVFCALLAFGTQAHALSLLPSDTPIFAEDDNPSQSVLNAAIARYIDAAEELYKAEVDKGEDTELPLWASYETVFYNAKGELSADPSAATITYTGGPIVGSPAYLVVKDGNHNPAWYLFDLFDLFDWDGMETLYLTGFWPLEGAISHVSLYGGVQPVPEPATILLLGAGLLGLVGYNRKRFIKKA